MRLLLYFSKVILLSGLLYGYYRGMLRNKQFHGYNRVYLLTTVFLSLLMPLLPVPEGLFWGAGPVHGGGGILHTIIPGNWEEPLILSGRGRATGTSISWGWLAGGLYLLIAALFLFIFLRSLLYIRRLSALYPMHDREGIRCYMTDASGTPFSFFKSIFWNSRLDMGTAIGQRIFRHEVYHIRERHTLDVLFLHSVKIVCWCNPFFYMIHRELKAVHEFLADRHALSGSDQYEYAELLLWESIRNQQASITHPFFHTHIKRRITMITQMKENRPGYFGRMMALPLFFVLFCAFATDLPDRAPYRTLPFVKPLTVVIDAGHGGFDAGAISRKGIPEKDIVLAIAKKIKQYSSDYPVNILMTREEDKMAGGSSNKEEGLRYRTGLANESKADLYISLHMNALAQEKSQGFDIYISPRNRYYQKSAQLGSAMLETLKEGYLTDNRLKEREEGIWVLTGTDMPAIMINCGNLDAEKDLHYMSDPKNQDLIAKNILKGIVHYQQDYTGIPSTAGEAVNK